MEINQKVILMDEAVRTAKIEGIKETVPTYRSLLVCYDPVEIDYEQLVSQVKDLREMVEKPNVKKNKKITVPVVYGGDYGPDLAYVASIHGMTEEQVVKLHSEKLYRVYMIGFTASFPYLGEVSDEIATPRLETPRLKVPAGSVGIAEKQTGIYPCEAPGGWRIVGRTPIKLFNPSKNPPAFMKAGDVVKFVAIDEAEFQRLVNK